MISVLKALADETRLKILEFLLVKERTVSEIVVHVGKAQPTVSLQLKLLQMHGLVAFQRKGKFVVYRIVDDRVGKVIGVLKDG